jgi:hypothetical protein
VNEIAFLKENKRNFCQQVEVISVEAKSYEEMSRRTVIETDQLQSQLKEMSSLITKQFDDLKLVKSFTCTYTINQCIF